MPLSHAAKKASIPALISLAGYYAIELLKAYLQGILSDAASLLSVSLDILIYRGETAPLVFFLLIFALFLGAFEVVYEIKGVPEKPKKEKKKKEKRKKEKPEEAPPPPPRREEEEIPPPIPVEQAQSWTFDWSQ